VGGIRDVDGQPEFGGGAGQILVKAGERVPLLWMIQRSVLPGTSLSAGALQGELVIARLGLDFLESTISGRLEVECGAGSIAAR
jgi:hypothetical protein